MLRTWGAEQVLQMCCKCQWDTMDGNCVETCYFVVKSITLVVQNLIDNAVNLKTVKTKQLLMQILHILSFSSRDIFL